MITLQNFKDVLRKIGFTENNEVFSKEYAHYEHFELRVDFKTKQIIYPSPITLGDTTTSNFEHPENFVVLECVTRLLDKGYRPEHIGLEKRWQLGRGASGGKADICVTDENNDMLFIIECKTAGQKYNEELKKMREDGGQLFSYLQQERSTRWLVLYASDLKEEVEYDLTIIKSIDDANILKMAEKDKSVLTFMKARSVEELFEVWDETYNQATQNDIIFSQDSVAYKIGERQLRKKDLKDFSSEDKIVNRFEEILRHNNVSDKENAFNRLIALFICKLVDEIKKGEDDIVDFQYKVGSDTYESLQDRLQLLHKTGMEEFMNEKINYIPDNYAEELFKNYSSSRRVRAIEDLRKTLRILKYYSNNDFSFKDVHNEELFFQNGKILVEVVQLFEKYRIVYPSKHQFLGDLFEQLLNKGFKQNEGQFFTPIPITRFIWDSLPIDKVSNNNNGYRLPKVIDYACGAGHFLTEAVEAINAHFKSKEVTNLTKDNLWVEKSIFGIEKDYRLARVAKVCLYMNGAGKGQIVFGDGLEQYPEKSITNETFDILVANPPYSVDSFKAHLKLKNNSFEILDLVSNTGDEIETLFVERIAQLLRPQGVAAVVLPITILSKDNNSSYVAAREVMLQNFNIRAIVHLKGKTFGATNTETIVMFLEKFNEPPKRKEQICDSVDNILTGHINDEWEDKEIFENYLSRISVESNDYSAFINKSLSLQELNEIPYFSEYVDELLISAELSAIKKTQKFKKVSEDDRQKIILEYVYSKIIEVEYEKLKYFALIYKQNTLIITAPKANDEQKRFLGYEWSNRRGSEGIKITSPGGMLFNDVDRFAEDTLASSIRYMFYDQIHAIPEKAQYCLFARLQDMLEFKRAKFNKAISLSPAKPDAYKTEYPLIKLGDYIKEERKSQIQVGSAKEIESGKYPFFTSGEKVLTYNEFLTDGENIYLSTGGNAVVKYYDGKAAYSTDTYVIRSKNENEILTKFLFFTLENITEYLGLYYFKGQGLCHLQKNDLKKDRIIPLPPLDIQKKIVNECIVLNDKVEKLKELVAKDEQKIQEIFDNLQNNPSKTPYRINDKDTFEICIGKRVLNAEVSPEYNIPVYSANVFEPFGMIDHLLVKDFSKDSILWGIDGDWMVNTMPANVPFYPTDHCGVLRIKAEDKLLSKYVAYLLKGEGLRLEFSRTNRASIDRIEGITIEAVPIEEQRIAIEKVNKFENEISKAKATIEDCTAQKKAILLRYLEEQ